RLHFSPDGSRFVSLGNKLQDIFFAVLKGGQVMGYLCGPEIGGRRVGKGICISGAAAPFLIVLFERNVIKIVTGSRFSKVKSNGSGGGHISSNGDLPGIITPGGGGGDRSEKIPVLIAVRHYMSL